MTQRVFDTHVHWRDPDNNPYELLSDAAGEDGEGRAGTSAACYMPQDYFNDSAGIEIIGFIHVEAEWLKTEPVNETLWLERLADRGSFGNRPLGIIGYADLSDSNVEQVLKAHAGYGRVRGIRHILNHHPHKPSLCWADRDYLADPTWHQNYAKLAHYDLDFDLMCFAHQMHPMAELASKHPETQIHLEHAGLPHEHTIHGVEEWRIGMKALAARKNVDVKISGLGNTIPDWTVDKFRTYVLDSIDIFGVERVSFASNFPTDKQFSSMAEIWNAFFEITKDFSPAECDAMFAGNAFRHYRIQQNSG